MIAWSPGIATHEELWRRWLARAPCAGSRRAPSAATISRSPIIDEFGVPRGRRTSSSPHSRGGRAAYFRRARAPAVDARPHYRLASVSNTNEIHWDRFSNTWKLDAAFHHNFPSYLVGKLKPDAEYFEHVLDALDVAPARVLFIDDNAINVEAAAKLGMHTRRVVGVDGAGARWSSSA